MRIVYKMANRGIAQKSGICFALTARWASALANQVFEVTESVLSVPSLHVTAMQMVYEDEFIINGGYGAETTILKQCGLSYTEITAKPTPWGITEKLYGCKGGSIFIVCMDGSIFSHTIGVTHAEGKFYYFDANLGLTEYEEGEFKSEIFRIINPYYGKQKAGLRSCTIYSVA